MANAKHKRPTKQGFLLSVKARQTGIPNCNVAQNCVLKSGPRTYRVASVLQFTNSTTGQITHTQLEVNDFPFRVDTGIQWELKDRLKHWSCKDDEIVALLAFLSNIEAIEAPGDYAVIDRHASPTLDQLLTSLAQMDSPNLAGIIAVLAERSEDLQTLPSLGESDNRRMVAAALRASHRTTALSALRALIARDAVEEDFQVLLDKNWWMLGGQFIERVPKRHWTDEENLDIMLRSADGGFHIIELKRSKAPLFKTHRGKTIVSADVNDGVNQAGHYISEIERQRDHFIARYDTDLYKVRARVLIGHISEDDPKSVEKRLALRMYNSHLHHIEVVSFDEVVRMADQVINANLGESKHAATTTDTEVPF